MGKENQPAPFFELDLKGTLSRRDLVEEAVRGTVAPVAAFSLVSSFDLAIQHGVTQTLHNWVIKPPRNDEGNNNFFVQRGEPLLGGEKLSDEELASHYLAVCESGSIPFADPTLIRSMFENSLRFFGTPKDVAKKRSERISITPVNDTNCQAGSFACTYDSTEGLSIELSQDAVDPQRHSGWKGLLDSIAHEGYHGSPLVEDQAETEEYGVLGNLEVLSDQKGFVGLDINGSLASQLINITYRNHEGYVMHINLAEEFFAEQGKKRFLTHLQQLAPDRPAREYAFASHSVYTVFQESFHDYESPENPLLTEETTLEQIDKLHVRNKRHEMFRRFGEAVLAKNAQTDPLALTEGDVAALGLIAFTDYTYSRLTNRNILYALSSAPILPNDLLNYAGLIQERLQARG